MPLSTLQVLDHRREVLVPELGQARVAPNPASAAAGCASAGGSKDYANVELDSRSDRPQGPDRQNS